MLGEFLLRDRDGRELRVEHDGARRGGALIDGDKMGRHGGNYIRPAMRRRAAESAMIREASSILRSNEFQAIRLAQAAGEDLTTTIGGRVVQYQANLTYAQAMTLREVNGFVMGSRAFSSPPETARAVSQELYRLQSGTLGVGQVGSNATDATRAAFGFAQRAGSYLVRVR
jgi:hypothetical protein